MINGNYQKLLVKIPTIKMFEAKLLIPRSLMGCECNLWSVKLVKQNAVQDPSVTKWRMGCVIDFGTREQSLAFGASVDKKI